ncbi:substrate-binding domain-containing protein [Bordetella sp. N]|uniref:substrate-binding domain-containing protein n=1 Tax=Bordetella sp. N TaxID=1746199 RepID=UPI0018D24757|nr:substrate-binding domain-containing protein [Bordetella sp. N]
MKPIFNKTFVRACALSLLVLCAGNASAQAAAAIHNGGAAVADLMFGREPYILLDRPLTPAERVPYRKLHGHLPLSVPLARIVPGPASVLHGGYALYVAADNPLRAVSRAQFQGILSEGQPGGTVGGWAQLVLDPAWRGRPITLYGPPPGDAYFQTWRAAALGRHPSRAGMVAVDDTRQRLARLTQDPGGMVLAQAGLRAAGAREVQIRADASREDAPSEDANVLYAHIGVAADGRADPAGSAYVNSILARATDPSALADLARILAAPRELVPLSPAGLVAARKLLDATPRMDKGTSTVAPAGPAGPAYLHADGAIYIVGNDGMQDMLEAFNALYLREHPDVKFRMRMEGSSTGGPALTAGVTPFAPQSRALWPADLEAFRGRYGYDPLDIRVGFTGHGPRQTGKTPPAVYVHRSNPLAGLEMAQLRRIFTAGQAGGDIDQWGQLGLQGAWAGRRIHVYGLADDGGSATSARLILLEGAAYTLRYETLPTVADVVRAVAADPYGIGMTGWVDAAAISADVRVLPLAQAADRPAVLPTYEHVAAGEYPFSSYVHFYVNRRPGTALSPFIKSYLEMVLSPAGQAIIAAQKDEEGGYVPLPPGLLAAEREKLN